MDKYIKGLLTAYNRVLNLIDAIDPNHLDASLECIRVRIEASIAAYRLFSSKEALDEFDAESQIKTKALDGSITLDELVTAIDQLRQVDSSTHVCKVLKLPESYFESNSNQ